MRSSNVSGGTAVPGFTNGLALTTLFVIGRQSSVTSGFLQHIVFIIADDEHFNHGATNSAVRFGNSDTRRCGNKALGVGCRIGMFVVCINCSRCNVMQSRDNKMHGQICAPSRITGIQKLAVWAEMHRISLAAGSAASSRYRRCFDWPLWVNDLLNSRFAGGGAAPARLDWAVCHGGSTLQKASGLQRAGETAVSAIRCAAQPFPSLPGLPRANTTYTLSILMELVWVR